MSSSQVIRRILSGVPNAHIFFVEGRQKSWTEQVGPYLCCANFGICINSIFTIAFTFAVTVVTRFGGA